MSAEGWNWEIVRPKDVYARSRLREEYGRLAYLVIIRGDRAHIKGEGGHLGSERRLSITELREEYGEQEHVAWGRQL